MIENTHPSIQGRQFLLLGMPSVLERGKITSHFSFQPNCILFPAGDAELQGMERGMDPTPSSRSDRSWTLTGISAGTRSLPTMGRKRGVSQAHHLLQTGRPPSKSQRIPCAHEGVGKPQQLTRAERAVLQQCSAVGVWPSKGWRVRVPPESRCHPARGDPPHPSAAPRQEQPPGAGPKALALLLLPARGRAEMHRGDGHRVQDYRGYSRERC